MNIITDILKSPFDEGAKIAALNLIQAYNKKYPCKICTINCNCKLPFVVNNFRLNKLLIDNRFYRHVKGTSHKKILYVPHSSITPATFVRAKLIRFYTGKEVNILSLQPVKYSFPAKIIVSAIRPARVLTQSFDLAKQLEEMGIKTSVLPLGVNDKKFRDCDNAKKTKLREKYSLDPDGKILIHVGHIKRARNIEWLMEVKKYLPKVNILVVGSTTTVHEEDLRRLLEKKGIIVLREYIPSIEEMYQLADWYVFPVLRNDAAIETPLSVLEAMSANLPVLTTRFGSLPDTFRQDDHFKFVNGPNDIVEALRNGFPDNCKNREKINPFTWEAVADRLHELV